MASVTSYLQLEPVWSDWQTDTDGAPKLAGMKITKTLKQRPLRIQGVVIKLTLNLPDKAFKPIAPEVVIDIPEEALEYEPSVTVDIPEEDDRG